MEREVIGACIYIYIETKREREREREKRERGREREMSGYGQGSGLWTLRSSFAFEVAPGAVGARAPRTAGAGSDGTSRTIAVVISSLAVPPQS